MSPTINHTFPNGTKFSGSFDELVIVSNALGFSLKGVSNVPRGYYPSETKGVVKISEMNEYHQRRALLKRSTDYLKTIFEAEDSIPTFLKKFTDLPGDPIVQDLYSALSNKSSK